MKVSNEVIIILLLVLLLGLFSFTTCKTHRDDLVNKNKYDSLSAKMDTLKWAVAYDHLVIDSLNNRLALLTYRKKIIQQKYVPKMDSVRHASTVQLDSIIRTIIARHNLLQ